MDGIVQIFIKIAGNGLLAGVAVLAVLFCRQVFLKKQPKQLCCLLWMVVFLRLLCPVTLNVALPAPKNWIESAALWDAQRQDGLGETEKTTAGQDGVTPGIVTDTAQAGAARNSVTAAGQTGAAAGSVPADGQTNLALDRTAAAGQVKTAENDVWTSDSQMTSGSVRDSLRENIQRGNYRRLLQIVSILWMAGAAVFLTNAIVRYGKLKRKLCTAVKSKVAGQVVWETDRIESPFVLGFLKPAVYLPTGLSETEKLYIAAHEQAHIGRHDYLFKALCYLGVIVHWMNPFAWIAFYFYIQDMEMACDERALQTFGRRERLDYSRTLLLTAVKGSGLSLPVFFGESNAKKRVQNILMKKKRTAAGICLTALLACMLAVILFTGGKSASERADGAEMQQAEIRSGSMAVLGSELLETALRTREDVYVDGENVSRYMTENEWLKMELESSLAALEEQIALQEETQRRILEEMEQAEEKAELIEENNEQTALMQELYNQELAVKQQLAQVEQELTRSQIMTDVGYDLAEEKKKELEALPQELQVENAAAYGIEMLQMTENDAEAKAVLRSFWVETGGNGSLPETISAIALENGKVEVEVTDDPSALYRKVKSMTILIGGTTDEGALFITSVTAWGGGYIVITDQSRDGMKGKDAEDMVVRYYNYLNWLTSEDGRWEEVVASDRKNLTYEALMESLLSSQSDAHIEHAYIGFFENTD